MKTQKKIVTALVSAAACLLPAVAHAHVTRVWYDAFNEPAGFNRQALLQTIQSSLREWEYHGRGQLALKWEGVTSNKPGGGGDDLIFGWDPSLVGSNTCAQTWIYTFAQVAPMGRIDMNPAIMGSGNVYTATPVVNANCLVGKSVLQHEMAHWFRWDAGHFNDSVLGSTCASGGICTDFMALNLWNGDMDGINQNNYFPIFAPTYPPLGVYVATDTYNHTNGAISGSSAVLLSGGGPQNFTAGMGIGGPSAQYSRAFTDNNTIAVEQGDGYTWSNRRTINEFTRRQVCVTGTSNSSDMYVVWTSNSQVPTANVANVGARTVRYSESHDGGNTWSAPGTIAGAQTRTGVSCGFDVARNRVVVAWANASTFQVQYSERTPSSVGAGFWTAGRTIPGPMTYEMPMLQFDPFTANSGMLTWHGIGNASDAVRSAVYFNGTQYALVNMFGVQVTASSAESADLRTNAVPNPFGTETHYAYGRNSGPPSSQIRTRRGSTYGAPVSDSATEATNYEPPVDRYVSSANDRIYYSSAYLRQIIYPH